MMKRTWGALSGPKGSTATACSALVRAPVSTFALIAGRPSPGKAAHSSHPKTNGSLVIMQVLLLLCAWEP